MLRVALADGLRVLNKQLAEIHCGTRLQTLEQTRIALMIILRTLLATLFRERAFR
jgi:hypothetical protein